MWAEKRRCLHRAAVDDLLIDVKTLGRVGTQTAIGAVFQSDFILGSPSSTQSKAQLPNVSAMFAILSMLVFLRKTLMKFMID
jgi:hypothetical protein